MDLGYKFKNIRYNNNISQDEMANILNINRSYLSRIETNKSLPNTDILITLAKEFGVSIDSLLDINTRKDEIKNKQIRIKKINNYCTNLNCNELDFIINLLGVMNRN